MPVHAKTTILIILTISVIPTCVLIAHFMNKNTLVHGEKLDDMCFEAYDGSPIGGSYSVTLKANNLHAVIKHESCSSSGEEIDSTSIDIYEGNISEKNYKEIQQAYKLYQKANNWYDQKTTHSLHVAIENATKEIIASGGSVKETWTGVKGYLSDEADEPYNFECTHRFSSNTTGGDWETRYRVLILANNEVYIFKTEFSETDNGQATNVYKFTSDEIDENIIKSAAWGKIWNYCDELCKKPEYGQIHKAEIFPNNEELKNKSKADISFYGVPWKYWGEYYLNLLGR